MSGPGWIGVDLDGTLAHYTGWKGHEHIGEPIPKMAARVREWLSQGYEVRIMTARAAKPEQAAVVIEWSKKHFGVALVVTNIKDFSMWMLWDDRAVAVEKNTGEHLMFPALLERP